MREDLSIIKSKQQYQAYVERLTVLEKAGKRQAKDEISHLKLLLNHWEEHHDPLLKKDPVQVLRACMKKHQLRQKDIVVLLGVSKGLVSDILAYRKGFSKESIRILADHFGVRQELFNRPYTLKA